MTIAVRKNNHIDICLNENVRSGISNGFEKFRLIHNALPEADFEKFSTETEFLGNKISAPFLISSMTGVRIREKGSTEIFLKLLPD